MSSSLEAALRQTLFLLREAPATRGIQPPEALSLERVVTAPELLSRFRVAKETHRRVVLIVAEAEFSECVDLLRESAGSDAVRFGIIAVAAAPDRFLASHSDSPELVDVLSSEKPDPFLAFRFGRAARHLALAEERMTGGTGTLERLNEVFITLSAERNPQRLLATVLVKAMELTLAEGGSLYMIHEKDGELVFRLRISNDRSDEVTIEHASAKVLENSVAGYVALTGKLLNIPRVDALRPMSLPVFNKQLDHGHPNGTRALVTVPLKNSRNEIIGVLQLVNKRSELGVTGQVPGAFSAEDESVLASYSTQAAICMENVDLYADIQRLFEGFVKASIAAIESRDPSTGGHSERVAKLCVGLARATTEVSGGIYRSVRFRDEEIRELEYAALLHDFGKIGVREEVLVKAKKLYPYQLDAIHERIKICRAAARIDCLEKRVKHGMDELSSEREYQARLKTLETYWSIIQAANEPSVLKKETAQFLERIRAEQQLLPDNSRVSLITEDEFAALSVSRGSLTASERLEIESHVRHTYQFLKMIPWTKDFRHLTEIAYAHHEKLDGTGYPRGLTSHEIPLQSKIMTIADIYDALTAADRWYKEAVPVEKALAILREEVTQGKLDPVLYELFVEKRIYELTQTKTLGQVA